MCPGGGSSDTVLSTGCVPACVLGALNVFLFNFHKNPIYTLISIAAVNIFIV